MKCQVHTAAALLLTALLTLSLTARADVLEKAEKARQEVRDGNYQDAFDLYQELLLEDECGPREVPQHFNMALQCLRSLNHYREIDGFRGKVVARHKDNWYLLQVAAQSFFNGTHYGTIVAGKFERGSQRGGGRYVNAVERDRVAALQLMEQAREVLEQEEAGEGGGRERSGFYLEYARILIGYRGYQEAWRLLYRTDLGTLPDYEEGYGYTHGSGTQGAPVDEEGKPVFHKVPESFDKAVTDGERWRSLLARAMVEDPTRKADVLRQYAGFLYNQFGVHTMAYYGRQYGGFGPTGKDDEKGGVFALHTLARNESIARLATGIARFELPDDANFMALYEELKDYNTLAQIYENRRQYPQAARTWEKAGYPERVNQITGNWGQFEPLKTFPAGEPATLQYRFRNGREVKLTAHEVKVPRLLADVRKYIKSNPRNLDWSRMNISSIGYLLVQEKESRYLGRKVASWSEKLEPRKEHFDRLTTLDTPLKKAGVYLVRAEMKDGNVSQIIVWVDNTVIVRKPMSGKSFFYVGDSVTGKPLPDTRVSFFGYRQRYIPGKWPKGDRYQIKTREFSARTDRQGRLFLGPDKYATDYTWLTTVHKDDRLAYLGFSGIWYGNYYDYEYNQTKVFTITDRPVYRPNQSVQFKFWVRHARYDQEDTSAFAGKHFTVRVNNPKGEKVFEEQVKADAYGGIEGRYSLPDDAALGTWTVYLENHGGSSFRVEEYKKPEFEVQIEAPGKPVMLGEKITAQVKAKYYFGSPVTKARVKVKILRQSHSSRWYPTALWDWFYGPGYWWFAYDYTWWPGWSRWGCARPHWWWWPVQQDPPELVAEAELPIGKDGTLRIPLDTLPAKELHGDSDHRYTITAEVTDESRRTIVGTGTVLVARKPFKVYAWVDRGHYRVGDVVHAHFNAQTLDHRGVEGKGKLTLFAVHYDDSGTPKEEAVRSWSLATDEDGRAQLQLKASKAGQYRLSYEVTDEAEHTIEGGYVFVVRGRGFDGKDFRFSELELVPDKQEYAPGEKVHLMVNVDRPGATVLLFVRPANSVYTEPQMLHLEGKSTVHRIAITKKDMPNFFVEALTVYRGRVFVETREIVVPPEKRVLNVAVTPDRTEYEPGADAEVKVRLTDLAGKPFVGATVIAVYDKAVEYVAGGSNVPAIRPFFWKWRRRHSPQTVSSLDRIFGNQIRPGDNAMTFLGIFGHLVQPTTTAGLSRDEDKCLESSGGGGRSLKLRAVSKSAPARAAPMGGARKKKDAMRYDFADDTIDGELQQNQATVANVEPTVRSRFADTAFWAGSLETDEEGYATVHFTMPENLSGWKIRTWAMGHGTRVGEETVEVVTRKNVMVRLQAPRFFVERDEVTISANIHNYLPAAKSVTAVLELEGTALEAMADAQKTLTIEAGGEERVDWRVKAVREGEAVIRIKALTDQESDAMQMSFPVVVHGMLKTESFSGVIRPNQKKGRVTLTVPKERRVDQTRLEVRFSPTLAGALVDSLPYLVSYPYGCTEQTLNRFLPTVVTRKVLRDMDIDLAEVARKRTNLNAQEIGDDKERAEQWQRWDHNPVFDDKEVNRMVRKGLHRLYSMQLSDGGWGWFSGWGEHSWPHTTATVVHGFQVAAASGERVDGTVLARGIAWLHRYQAEQVRLIKRAPAKKHPYKVSADNLDAFVYMVLADAGEDDKEMRTFLYRDRKNLAVYGKSLFGMALHTLGHQEERDMLVRNIEQFLVEDPENQTAYLDLRNGSYWWYWYGSEFEAQAYYLKLLARVDPKSTRAAGLVKYLLNNRKHATRWNSTRDTALCVEAMADYLRASGEGKPDLTVHVKVDGEVKKSVRITAENLFSFDNKLVLEGRALSAGEHTLELVREGQGPVYFNAYLTNFTLEEFIEKAGLEIKVQRKLYKLEPVEASTKVAGARGQALDQKVEKYLRVPLANWDTLKSGDLVEIELEIESKNDYEYIVFEDMKAAGFEPVELRSGYSDNKGLHAYREFRDEKVAFFVRRLARGRHSMAYRMRAEIPGRFSALPTRAMAMYAPELKANSDEFKVEIVD